MIDKLADSLLKRKEKFDGLLKFSSKATGLTSFLTRESREDILLREAEKKIPDLKSKLLERKEFFDRKTIKSDHIRILSKEIAQCDDYISKLREEAKTEDIKIILDWYDKIYEKYGF